jgi:hypothetical protein
MNLYSIDVRVYATAYIKAESKEEAERIAKEKLCNVGLEFPDTLDWMDPPLSGLAYTNPNLPDVSLSTSMTIFGIDDDVEVQLSQENIPTGG